MAKPAKEDPRVTYAAQRASASAALLEAGLTVVETEQLLAAGRDAIALRVRAARVADTRVGATRLGGLPDLPPGLGWPSREGYAFEFVGQLSCGDLSPFDVHRLLPSEGLLSFFAGHDVTESSEWQLDFRVRHHPAGGELSTDPGDTASRPRHRRAPKPRGVDFEPAFFLPPPWSRLLPELTRRPAYEDVFDAIYKVTCDPVFPLSGLLGFDRPREGVLAPEESMLLRLDVGEAIPYSFYESCTLCFVLSSESLRRRSFDDVRCFEGASI